MTQNKQAHDDGDDDGARLIVSPSIRYIVNMPITTARSAKQALTPGASKSPWGTG